MQKEGLNVIWSCDPMQNTIKAVSDLKQNLSIVF